MPPRTTSLPPLYTRTLHIPGVRQPAHQLTLQLNNELLILKGAFVRIEGDQSDAMRLGLREPRADVLEGEQERPHVVAFTGENRQNEGSRHIGLASDHLSGNIAERAIGYPQFRGVSAGRDGLVCKSAQNGEPVGPCLSTKPINDPRPPVIDLKPAVEGAF